MLNRMGSNSISFNLISKILAHTNSSSFNSLSDNFEIDYLLMDHESWNGFQSLIDGYFHDLQCSSPRNASRLLRMNLQEMNLILQLCC